MDREGTRRDGQPLDASTDLVRQGQVLAVKGLGGYHLAVDASGTLFVTGPTTSSNQTIHQIDRDGNLSVFYQGLGRAQGIAFDVDDNLYVAASLRGQRGIIRITPQREASVAVSGNNLVGLAFLEDGCAALATRDSLYHVDLGIDGRPLI